MYFNNSQIRFLAAIYGLIVVIFLGIGFLCWLMSLELSNGFNVLLWLLMLGLVVGFGVFMLYASISILVNKNNQPIEKLVAKYPDKANVLARSFGVAYLVLGLYYTCLAVGTLTDIVSINQVKLLLFVGLGIHALWDISIRRHYGIKSS
jgi:hypothetical protein